ncbi:MAG: LuxR C-terminal-related transcriptional regulator [Gammaproteobacteria bacterium]
MATLTEPQLTIVRSIINHTQGLVLLKDMDSVYTMANTSVAKMAGFDSPDQLVGITDYDIRNNMVSCAALFVVQDKKVIASGEPMISLDIVPVEGGELRALMHNKSILKDEAGSKLGVLMHAFEVPKDLLIKTCVFLSDHSTHVRSGKHPQPANYLLSDHYEGSSLTKRQAECLFYLLRGMSCKSIAKTLGLSHRTIEGYVEIIKFKMGCHSKQELIERSIERGYVEIIPSSIFNSILLSTLK